jgi:hypothetical protein
MIYFYGDSHASKSFKNLTLNHINLYQNSITMHRIGRDNKIINFNNNCHDNNSFICFVYGEVDCRCHIQRQINLGRNEDDIIDELVSKYFETIKNNVIIYGKIVIVAIIPTTQQNELESIHGPILHEYPFVGTDENRVRYTKKMNELMNKYCKKKNYIFFNPYDEYTREDGTLKYELSDTYGHLGQNVYFLEQFIELYNKFIEL